jgi:hypothetical protein
VEVVAPDGAAFVEPAVELVLASSLGTATNKWHGGVLSPQGMIYGIPYNSEQVLRIDPATETAVLVGDYLVSDVTADPATTNKWGGGVLSLQGMIYGIPYKSEQVLRIDPATDTAVLVGSELGSATTHKWDGGVLSPQGMIYGIPYNSEQVLRIDPTTDTTSLVGSFYPEPTLTRSKKTAAPLLVLVITMMGLIRPIAIKRTRTVLHS